GLQSPLRAFVVERIAEETVPALLLFLPQSEVGFGGRGLRVMISQLRRRMVGGGQDRRAVRGEYVGDLQRLGNGARSELQAPCGHDEIAPLCGLLKDGKLTEHRRRGELL